MRRLASIIRQGLPLQLLKEYLDPFEKKKMNKPQNVHEITLRIYCSQQCRRPQECDERYLDENRRFFFGSVLAVI